jgi:hypothetical protein
LQSAPLQKLTPKHFWLLTPLQIRVQPAHRIRAESNISGNLNLTESRRIVPSTPKPRFRTLNSRSTTVHSRSRFLSVPAIVPFSRQAQSDECSFAFLFRSGASEDLQLSCPILHFTSLHDRSTVIIR